MSTQVGTRELSPDGRRAFEEEFLIGDVTETIAGLLDSLSISQRELAERLGVTEGRVSQILGGSGNLTLRSLAAVGWALGIKFGLRATPMVDRSATPAVDDSPAPAWLRSVGGEARLVRGYQKETPSGLETKWGSIEPTMRVTTKGDVILQRVS